MTEEPGTVHPQATPAPEPIAAAVGDAAPILQPYEPALPQAVIPPVSSTRALLGTSFDLLGRSTDQMRRASFYIGAVVLGTVGPFALASWAIQVIAFQHADEPFAPAAADSGQAAFVFLLVIATVGIIVAAVESRTLAMSVLGGVMAGRPLTARQAVARSRRVFWRSIVSALIVGIAIGVVQGVADQIVTSVLGPQVDVSIVISTLAAAIVGAPLAYVLAGVVLGDVDPFEALRRSFRVFRARKTAAALVAAFETVAILLIFVGLGAGLDIVLRVLDALGLGPDAGPVGVALMTMGLVATVFAAGTLLFTVYAITVAPQVVMFVGLTHATMGLDHVRPGGSDDPAITQPGKRRFRWFTRPMLLGIGLAILGLVIVAVGYSP